jgi:acyl carrier protein
MIQLNTEQRVLKVVSRISGDRAVQINMENDLKTELSLDSVQMVELFAALEKEFKTEFPLQLMNARTGKEFLNILEVSLKQ